MLLDLASQSSIVSTTRSWFVEFLGVQGYAYLNTTYSVRIEKTTISSGLVSIVDYIKIQIEKEIQVLCPQCNFSFPAIPYKPIVNVTINNNTDIDTGSGSGNLPNETDGGNGTDSGNNGTNATNGTDVNNGTNTTNGTDVNNGTNSTNGTDVNNGTNSTNGTDNSTTVLLRWNSVNYTLPVSCSFINGNSAVRCSAGIMRGVTYTFTQLNAWYESSISKVCSSAASKYSSCESNTVIKDQNTCFRLSYFNQFQLDRTQQLYAWLYFDQAARDDVFSQCQSSQNNWALTNEQFTAGFQFAFGNLQ